MGILKMFAKTSMVNSPCMHVSQALSPALSNYCCCRHQWQIWSCTTPSTKTMGILKLFAKTSMVNSPLYASVTIRGIVPCNPYLLLRYECMSHLRRCGDFSQHCTVHLQVYHKKTRLLPFTQGEGRHRHQRDWGIVNPDKCIVFVPTANVPT